MAGEGNDLFPNITIQDLKGLNERNRFSNPDITEFDYLRNAIPGQLGALQKMLGCKRNVNWNLLTPSPILSIVQTFDSAHNIIIQTRDGVWLISEEDLFGIVVPAPDLTPYTPPELGDIIAITATNPAEIETALPHARATGDWVILSGIVGGTFSVPINGTFQITVTSPTKFTVVSDCTVIPTDLTAAEFTVTVNPAYNGDDELYPQAVIAGNSNLDVANTYGGFGTVQFFDFLYQPSTILYQMNPDGSPASFVSVGGLLQQGEYRIEGWCRSSGTSTTTKQIKLFGLEVGYSAQQQTIQNENNTLHFTLNQTVSTPTYILPTVRIRIPAATNTSYHLGKAVSGFSIYNVLLRITKTA